MGALSSYIGAYFWVFLYTLTFGEYLFSSSLIIIIIFSGHEVGRLLLEVPLTVRASRLTKEKIVSDKLHDTGTERQNPNFGSGISITYVLEDSCLMKKVNWAFDSICSPPGHF